MIRSVRPTLRCGDVVPTATLTVDNPDDNPALREPIVGSWIPQSGFAIFDLPEPWPNGPFGANLHVEADGYMPYEGRFTLADFHVIPPDAHNANLRIQTADGAAPYPLLDFTLTPVRPVVTLGPLHVAERGFVDDHGTPWPWIGCSDFRLFDRFIKGEHIQPIIDERLACGFNQLRVFAMCGNMFHFFPQEHPDYQAKLTEFLDLLGSCGLRTEFTVMVDATVVMPRLEDQQRFWAEVCVTVAGRTDVFLELVNEVDQTINVIDTTRFEQPAGVISCHGSKGIVDAAREPVCVTPVWTYGVLHPKREPDWPRYGHNIDEDVYHTLHVAGVINESCRPDQGRGPIPSDHFDAIVNMLVMGGGGTFHSQAGKDSRLFDATEKPCAEAWGKGAKVVNLALRNGQYVAGHLYSPPFPVMWREGDSTRAHGRILGGQAMCSLPQMRDGYVPVAQDGWRIVKQDGSYVECVRP